MTEGSDERVSVHRTSLLEHARGHVTVADIEAYATCIDPGYPAYVEQLSNVLRSSGRDAVDQVDWEPIFHAYDDDPQAESNPLQFRRYRVFVAAIGSLHWQLCELIAPHALAISLVEDVSVLEEPRLAAIAYLALGELGAVLADHGEAEAPFVLLASLLVGSMARIGDAELSALALRVFDAEATHHGHAARRNRESSFLWDCARRVAVERWKRCIEQCLPSSTQSLASLRTVLLRTLIAV